jgi:hypothetical protein
MMAEESLFALSFLALRAARSAAFLARYASNLASYSALNGRPVYTNKNDSKLVVFYV